MSTASATAEASSRGASQAPARARRRASVPDAVRLAVKLEHCSTRVANRIPETCEVRFVAAGSQDLIGRIPDSLATTACWSWLRPPKTTNERHLILIGDRFASTLRPEIRDDEAAASRLAVALYRHETGHARFTSRDTDGRRSAGQAHRISPQTANIAEDLRIEHILRSETGTTFGWADVWEDPMIDARAPDSLLNAVTHWEDLAVAQERMAQRGVPPHLVAVVAEYAPQIMEATSTEETIATTRRFLDAYAAAQGAADPQPGDPSQPNPSQPNPSESGGGAGGGGAGGGPSTPSPSAGADDEAGSAGGSSGGSPESADAPSSGSPSAPEASGEPGTAGASPPTPAEGGDAGGSGPSSSAPTEGDAADSSGEKPDSPAEAAASSSTDEKPSTPEESGRGEAGEPAPEPEEPSAGGKGADPASKPAETDEDTAAGGPSADEAADAPTAGGESSDGDAPAKPEAADTPTPGGESSGGEASAKPEEASPTTAEEPGASGDPPKRDPAAQLASRILEHASGEAHAADPATAEPPTASDVHHDIETGESIANDIAIIQAILSNSDNVDAGEGQVASVGTPGSSEITSISGSPFIHTHRTANELDMNVVTRCARRLEKAMEGNERNVMSRRPSPRVDVERVISGANRIYRRRQEGRGLGSTDVLLIVDTSGSMRGGHIDGGRHLVAVLSELSRRGRVEGSVAFTQIKHGEHRCQTFRLPMPVNLIERIPADGEGEGIARSIDVLRPQLRQADVAALYSDCQITDTPVNLAECQRQGIFLHGLYVGSLQMAGIMRQFTYHPIAAPDIETLVDRFGAQLIQQ